MKRNFLILLLCWIMVVGASLSWNIWKDREEDTRVAYRTIKTFFDFICLTRRWNAQHGGVYVRVTNNTRPNPYLKDPLRDIRVNKHLMLTKENPAYMTRELSNLSQRESSVSFHMAGLHPLNPANTPTPLEKKAFNAFSHGKKDFFLTKKNFYFYMSPLITRSSCLRCHRSQGYRVGEVIGGISVRMFHLYRTSLFSLILGHLVIGILGIFVIICFWKKLESAYKKIERQAIRDPLTGLYNRREFDRRLGEEFKRAKRYKMPLSVMMCDIDWFKSYNDTYGHQKGDVCLKEVAVTIDSFLKRGGDFCARYGGEEFVVVLPQTDEEGARDLALCIKKAIEELGIHHQASPFGVVTLSIGITTEKEFSVSSPHIIIKRADMALYLAKKNGRNRIESL